MYLDRFPPATVCNKEMKIKNHGWLLFLKIVFLDFKDIIMLHTLRCINQQRDLCIDCTCTQRTNDNTRAIAITYIEYTDLLANIFSHFDAMDFEINQACEKMVSGDDKYNDIVQKIQNDINSSINKDELYKYYGILPFDSIDELKQLLSKTDLIVNYLLIDGIINIICNYYIHITIPFYQLYIEDILIDETYTYYLNKSYVISDSSSIANISNNQYISKVLFIILFDTFDIVS